MTKKYSDRYHSPRLRKAENASGRQLAKYLSCRPRHEQLGSLPVARGQEAYQAAISDLTEIIPALNGLIFVRNAGAQFLSASRGCEVALSSGTVKADWPVKPNKIDIGSTGYIERS